MRTTIWDLIGIIMWMAGFMIAKGFWQTLATLFFPYAWYLFIERILVIFKII